MTLHEMHQQDRERYVIGGLNILNEKYCKADLHLVKHNLKSRELTITDRPRTVG